MSAPERIPPRRVSRAAAAGTSEADAPEPAGRPGGEELSSDAVRELLEQGTLTVLGQLRDASNAVLYGTVAHRERSVPCVYKPVAGERPLWDFPDGTLAEREVAAYELSRATGWDLVPATVLRDGPYGPGMCQAWVGELPNAPDPTEDGADPTEDGADAPDEQDGPEDPDDPAASAEPDPFGPAGPADPGDSEGDSEDAPLLALVEREKPGEGWKPVGFADVGGGRTALLVHADDPRLRRLSVLDAVINNGDRKGGHLLPVPGGRLYAIDHGVTFNADEKLRTLLWGWAGEELTGEASEVLRTLSSALAEGEPLACRLGELLTDAEVEAVRKRTETLLGTGRHPLPSGDWPAIPWPPV